MLGVWKLVLEDKDKDLWMQKRITSEGVDFVYYRGNFAVYSPFTISYRAIEILNDPVTYFRSFFGIDGTPVGGTFNLVTGSAMIDYEHDDRYYTLVCDKMETCFSMYNEEPPYGRTYSIESPSPDDVNGDFEIEVFGPSYLSRSKSKVRGYVVVKHFYRDHYAIALWKLGTYVIRNFGYRVPVDEAVSRVEESVRKRMTRNSWPCTMNDDWVYDEARDKITLGTSSVRRSLPLQFWGMKKDENDIEYEVRGKNFRVVHLLTGDEYVVTRKQVIPVSTKSRNVFDLFRKVFSGNYKYV